jgi:RHS repeat-associated protein
VRVVTGANSQLYFAYADHLGSVSALTDSSGTLVNGSLARYEPFGGFRTVSTTNPAITDLGFTGHKQNNTGTPDLGLIYMNARYYLPEIGRFISADSLVPDSQNPQSFNRYSYGYNNPVKYTDPSGHDPLGAQWRLEFEAAHHRLPTWEDEMIRLFSIAFPEEWEWSRFYLPDGTYNGMLGVILNNPPASRSWDTFAQALSRLSAAYTAEEEAFFVQDVAFLFASLPSRSQNPGWRGNRPYYTLTAFNSTSTWLQRGSLDLAYILNPNGNSDRDNNVHHWAWAFALGYNLGEDAILINTGRELTQIRVDNKGNLAVNYSDVAIGNAGAIMGVVFASNDYGYTDIPSLFNWFNRGSALPGP